MCIRDSFGAEVAADQSARGFGAFGSSCDSNVDLFRGLGVFAGCDSRRGAIHRPDVRPADFGADLWREDRPRQDLSLIHI